MSQPPKRSSQTGLGTGLLVLGLLALPNTLTRGYGFSSGLGFPLAYSTWRDYGPPFDFFHPSRLVLDVVICIAAAFGASSLMRRCAHRPVRIRRSWAYLVAAVPFVVFFIFLGNWQTRIQFALPILICVWLFTRPSPLPWILLCLLYVLIVLVSFPAAAFLSDDLEPTFDLQLVLFFFIPWSLSMALTWWLVRPTACAILRSDTADSDSDTDSA